MIEVKTTKPADDPRTESRKIRAESIQQVGQVEDRKERRAILEKTSELSLDIPMNEKRTMTLLKPRIEAFNIKKKPADKSVQITLNGKPFKRNSYGDVELIYNWRCHKCCQFCTERPHRMQCFDWGTNVLYRRYKDEKEARVKVKQKCFYQMKYAYDAWFALGTHSQRPLKRWMIVGLLWMKKAS